MVIYYIIIFSLILNFINPYTTSLILYRKVFYNYNIKKIKFISIKKIPKYTKQMLIRTEDCNFYKHHGIDLDSIKNAMEINKRIKCNSFGGSTITQQVVRSLFLFPNKYMARKYLEIVIAIIFDRLVSKERILELYFNYAEWGKGIFGIENASNIYFGKSVKYLSYDESAKLIAILSSPIYNNPDNFYNRKDLLNRYNNLIFK
jgi:membrane peptidoglycan carboxypeptidase